MEENKKDILEEMSPVVQCTFNKPGAELVGISFTAKEILEMSTEEFVRRMTLYMEDIKHDILNKIVEGE